MYRLTSENKGTVLPVSPSVLTDDNGSILLKLPSVLTKSEHATLNYSINHHKGIVAFYLFS